MNTFETPQPTEEVTTLEDIFDIELKICQVLNIETQEFSLQPPTFDIKTLNNFKIILRKIYNRLLKSPNEKKNHVQIDDSHTFESFQEKEAYQQIEDLLQKQENKNRIMLKKQFEFKEYLNTVIDQLNEQKSNNRKRNFEISKLNQELQEKSLQILHLKNQSKAFQRGSKDIFIDQITTTKNKGSYHLSSFTNFNGFQTARDEKKAHISRQRQNSKSEMKKNKMLKQNALYALYNYHKQSVETRKNHSCALTSKKQSQTQRQISRKNPFKDMNSQQLSNKNLLNLRRKSEEIFKKTPSQRELREQKSSKKKFQLQMIRHKKLI